ncbi:MAG: type II secretion system protein [Phycisphaerales bacterium]|nr:type II secretion system protein [Planctomycetota bacterium]
MASRRHRGFSLVELLVSLAVIGVIISLVLVALSSARDRAAQVRCMANMRQVQAGIALMGGKDGLLPYASFIPVQADGPSRSFQDMMFALCDATGVARPVDTGVKTSKGWRVYTVSPVFQCPRDKANTVDVKTLEDLGYAPEFPFAQQVFMSADYVPGGKMSMLARRGMAPDAVQRTITRLWEQAPWVPVLDELWQWHNYKSRTAYGNASYIDGSVRQSDWGTVEQRKRWSEQLSHFLPGDS